MPQLIRAVTRPPGPPGPRSGFIPLSSAVVITLVAGLVMGGVAWAQAPWVAPETERAKQSPLPPSAKAVADGEKLAHINCVPCHGASGKGDGAAAPALNPKPRDWTSPSVQSESDGELFWKISNGRRAMPSWKFLPENGRWALVQYIRSLRTATVPVPSSPAPARLAVSQGTGFAVRPDGVVLTVFHVVRDAKAITVLCPGRERETATLADAARNNDLAVLRTSLTGMPYLSLAKPGSLKIGDTVFTIGFPATNLLGLQPKFNEGSVSALSGLRGEATVIQTSVPIQPGNSGGALLTNDGSVVGVITSTAAVQAFLSATGALPQSINWAVKSEYAAPLYDQPTLQPPAMSRSDAIDLALKATCLIEATR